MFRHENVKETKVDNIHWSFS